VPESVAAPLVPRAGGEPRLLLLRRTRYANWPGTIRAQLRRSFE